MLSWQLNDRAKKPTQNLHWGYKQQPESPLTEDLSTQESHHDHGRVFSRLKQPSRSNASGEELIRTEDLHVFGNDSWQQNRCFMGRTETAKTHTKSAFVSVRSFEEGLADRGGWRKEILPTPRIQAFFLSPFFAVLWALLVTNSLPKPLFETSDIGWVLIGRSLRLVVNCWSNLSQCFANSRATQEVARALAAVALRRQNPSSEANSGSIHPYSRYWKAAKTRKSRPSLSRPFSRRGSLRWR